MTLEELKERIHYNPDTGEFRWKKNIGSRAKQGAIAGSLGKRGYRQICFDGKIYPASHVAKFYMSGNWPKEEMDHKNRVRHDDRWNNLREATKTQNKYNRTQKLRDFPRGVCKDRNSYSARCSVNGKTHYLGSYTTPNEAHIAYKEFAKKNVGEFYFV
jgi:hypothetical protein